MDVPGKDCSTCGTVLTAINLPGQGGQEIRWCTACGTICIAGRPGGDYIYRKPVTASVLVLKARDFTDLRSRVESLERAVFTEQKE